MPSSAPTKTYSPAFQKKHPKIATWLKNQGLGWTSQNVARAKKKLAERKKRKQNNPKRPSEADSAAPWQIIYGTVRTGGTITYAHVKDDYYYMVITLAGHAINGINKIYFNTKEVTFASMETLGNASGTWAGHVYAQLNSGDTGQAALSQLVSDSAGFSEEHKWKSTDQQRGHAHIYLRLKYKESLFPKGLPEITFEIRGKPVYDPRTATTYFSNNAALIAADYLVNQSFGCSVPPSDIDYDNVGWAANICGETMTEPSGSTNAPGIRYSIDGILDTDDSASDVREMMADAMGGFITRIGREWRIQPGVWVGPAVSIDESHLVGELNVQTRIPRRESFNGVRGTFVSPQFKYEEGDFPPVTASIYLDQDAGYELWEDITLPLTTHPTTAQRLAKLFLERVRQPMTVTVRVKPKILQLTPIDTVLLTYSRLGWFGKEFEITEIGLELQESNGGPILGAVVTLKETASEIYDWNEGHATTVDYAPETDLPDPGHSEPPTSLTLESGNTTFYIRQDGSVVPRIKASWTAPILTVVSAGGYYELEWKRSSDASWTDTATVPGNATSYYISDVEDGLSYDVRVRTINSFGVPSDWATVTGHTVVGKTTPPSDVTGFSITKEESGSRLRWQPVLDRDLSEYEIRQGTDWDTGTWFLDTRSTDYLWNVRTAGTYDFWIKAIDTSGNYSATAANATLSIANPQDPSITFTIEGDSVTVKWTKPSSDYPIEIYSVWFGDTFGTSELVAETKGTTFKLKGSWLGSKKFFVIARDVAGNESSESGHVDVTITAPDQVATLTSEIVDNNVLLYWSSPSVHTLPIDHYDIYKGLTFDAYTMGSATFIGRREGTFTTTFETFAATYYYWVIPVDTAGNIGASRVISTIVNQPPDFILRADHMLTDYPSFDVLTNVYAESSRLLVPVNETETWQDHFTSHGYTTIQDQIDAGFPIYLQPTPGSGLIEETIDFGAVFPGSMIVLSYFEDVIDNPVDLEATISYSNDGVSFTAAPAGVTQFYATNFRYVKVSFDVDSMGGTGLIALSQIRLRIQVKKQTDSGNATATAGDAGGTVVNFSLQFADVDSIQVTPLSTSPLFAVYDFLDAPNPTSFKVLIFNASGVRQTVPFSWTAEGAVLVT
jgi:hypothetical protein